MNEEQFEIKKKKIINLGIKLIVFSVCFFIILILLFKFYIQNDVQTGLKINKIITISTASGSQELESDTIWHLNLSQDNDILIYLEENEKYADKDKIKKISIENFSSDKESDIGTVEVYKDSDEDRMPIERIQYDMVEIKPDLEINNICEKGGVIKFKISNNDIGEYISNDDTIVNHDGTILKKANLTVDKLKFNISFNLIIENTSGKKYKIKITLNLPNEDLLENGITTKEITDFSNTKFERIY